MIEIYEYFGILPRFLVEFLKCGLITKLPQQEGGLYIRQSVEDLFRALAEKCLTSTESDVIDENIVTLKKICRRFDVPLIAVIHAILNSEIIPKFHYTRNLGLDSICISRCDIVDFSIRYKLNLGGIQRRHAADLIGVQQLNIKDLIDRGFLEELQFNSARPFKYLSIESVRNFKRTCVPTVFIAKLLRTRGDVLEKRLLDLDLFPIIPRSRADFTAYWGWADLLEKLPEANSWRSTFLEYKEVD